MKSHYIRSARCLTSKMLFAKPAEYESRRSYATHRTCLRSMTAFRRRFLSQCAGVKLYVWKCKELMAGAVPRAAPWFRIRDEQVKFSSLLWLRKSKMSFDRDVLLPGTGEPPVYLTASSTKAAS